MGALLVYRHARLRLERTTREDPEQIERRLEELRSLAWTPAFELAVEGKSRLLPILCMFLASGAVLVPLVEGRARPLVAMVSFYFVAAILVAAGCHRLGGQADDRPAGRWIQGGDAPVRILGRRARHTPARP